MKQRTNSKLRVTSGQVLDDLFSKVIPFDGRRMSMREAMIRACYKQSLAGDMNAALDLQKLRDACGITDDAQPVGCLVLPEPISQEEFEKRAYESQAKYREKNHGKGEL